MTQRIKAMLAISAHTTENLYERLFPRENIGDEVWLSERDKEDIIKEMLMNQHYIMLALIELGND